MNWFNKKPKTALQLMLNSQTFWRTQLNDLFNRVDAKIQLGHIDRIINLAAEKELSERLEARFKSIEDAIADLYLVGKAGENDKGQ